MQRYARRSTRCRFSKTYGQPDGLQYSVDSAQLKGDTVVVRVKIENITDKRKVAYSPCQPTLTDYDGNTYASKGTPADEAKSIYPQEHRLVEYVFEKPVKGANLILTFSRQVEDPQTHSSKELVTDVQLNGDQIAPDVPEESATQKGPAPKEATTAPRWLVSLPHSFKLSPELTDMPADWINKFYPMGSTPWVETFSDGSTRMVVSMSGGKLHGASTSLYRNGNISALAIYVQGSLSGPLRLWDEDGNMVLYSEYVSGKRTGLTVAFKENKPALAQTWNDGRLMKEYLIDGNTATPLDDSTESEDLDGIHKQVKELTAQIAQNGTRLKKFAGTIATRMTAMTRPKRSNNGSSGASSVQFRDVLNGAYKVPVLVP